MTPDPPLSPPATAVPEVDAGRRLADAVTTHYALDVRAIARIAKGMGTTNWRVRTSAEDCFLKQYPPDADVAAEAAALELSQAARAAGVPAPRVIPSATGELLRSEGGLTFALLEYFPDATSGGALSSPDLRQHYFDPLERQAALDRFWLQRCEAAEMIFARLDELSERFGSAWTRRGG